MTRKKLRKIIAATNDAVQLPQPQAEQLESWLETAESFGRNFVGTPACPATQAGLYEATRPWQKNNLGVRWAYAFDDQLKRHGELRGTHKVIR